MEKRKRKECNACKEQMKKKTRRENQMETREHENEIYIWEGTFVTWL